MILKKIVVENFRQFRGKQVVEFSSPTDSNGNVTVIFGENGRGKTGLFRAIMFCLFGDRQLSQDGEAPSKELQLVNTSALHDSPHQPITTSVELEFMHKGNTYILSRSIRGLLDGDHILEEDGGKKLYLIESDGNTKSVPATEIDETIDRILDRRVKDYFLFDGEKIERLTRASVEQRREISIGIRNLLNVDALETAIKAVGRISKSLEKELANSSNEDLSRLLKHLGDNEDEQEKIEESLENLASEISLARIEIDKTDTELKKFDEIRHLLDRRKSYEQDLEGYEQSAIEALSDIKRLVCKAATLMISPTINNVYEYIEKQKVKGEIPSEIRRDLIEKILDEKRCICGSDVCEGSDSYSHIISWLNRTKDVSTQDAALNLWRYLSEICNHFGDDADLIEKNLQRYGNIHSSIANLQHSLSNLRDQIGSSERQDASKLDDIRKNLQNRIISLSAQANVKESRSDDLKLEHNRLEASLKEEKLKVSRTDELSCRAILTRDTLDALNNVYAQFTEEIKSILSVSATTFFQQLLDKEGRDNLRSIKVNDDYSLQVLDRYKRPFLANISAGQRQIMSISFIAALAQKASHQNIIEIPLFMDTPFGRLSYEHRRNLINQLPSIASQWILLATDTEFRRQEADLLKKSGKLGKFYVLSATEDGNTIIKEQNINDVMSTLLEREEDNLE